MKDDVKEKLWNIHLIVEDLKLFPQTYDTILGECRGSGTCQTILRRKLNKLCKEGMVCKTTIPGTRFGKALFYMLPKYYYILVEGDRLGSNVFCFFDYEKRGKYYLQVNECWQLNGQRWDYKLNKVFFEGNVLKFM